MYRFLIFVEKWALAMPMAAFLLFAAATGSLLTAFVAENFFNVQPCILCIYQRIPYAIVAFLAIFALSFKEKDLWTRRILCLAALVFFVNMGIAVFHSGVELHWWKGTESCGVNPSVLLEATGKVASAREMLLKTPTVQCDAINFTFLGFTMANWNILASFGLGLFALLASIFPHLSRLISAYKKD